MSEELLQRYGLVTKSLNGIKLYNVMIISLGIMSYYMNIEHFYILFALLTINCIINFIFFKKLCNYLERLNKLFMTAK